MLFNVSILIDLLLNGIVVKTILFEYFVKTAINFSKFLSFVNENKTLVLLLLLKF